MDLNQIVRKYEGTTDIISDLEPHSCSNLKSLSSSSRVGLDIFEGVLEVLALSIFPVDLNLIVQLPFE